MSNPVREQLLGYLLGALDEAEQASIEEQLERDPRLRLELAEMREMLRPLEASRDEFAPPPGLASRTCQRVFSAPELSAVLPPPEHVPVPSVAPTVVLPSFHWSDVTAGATVFFLALILLLPAIQSSRFAGQLEVCQDNLRKIGFALENYSQRHAGYFPAIPAKGKLAAAGVYAPTLLRSGLLTEPQSLICPAAAQRDQRSLTIPSLDELESASEEEASQLRCSMGGSYGYSLGYLHHGEYRSTQNLHRATFALAADAPSAHQDHQSPNHANQGQNVLFEDGRVQFLRSSQLIEGGDDIFVNDNQEVAAGLHLNDAVIAPREARPFVLATRER